MKIHRTRPIDPRRFFAAAIAAIAFAGASAPSATAEIYRCTGPDGGIVYTDNKAACPGAGKHEPAGRLQAVSEDAEPAAAPAQHRPPDAFAQNAEDQRGQKVHWQQLKRTKEAELRALEERHAQLGRSVTACNRGHRIVSRDETGIKHQVPCERIRKEYAETLELQAPLREYLETGLVRDCRRAGCLPGWLR
jgi:hypothetical protein